MYSFIVNPNASGGRGERIWRRLEKQLKHLGVSYEAFVTEKTGDARSLACDLTEHQREPIFQQDREMISPGVCGFPRARPAA